MSNEEYDNAIENLHQAPFLILDAEFVESDPNLAGWLDGVASVYGIPIVYFNWKGRRVPEIPNHHFLSGDAAEALRLAQELIDG